MEQPGLLYEPAPSVPESFWEEFNRIVPLSPNGKDRMLRIVWGVDRLEYVAGYEERRYGDTDNDPPKYVGRARWVLEGWQPPDIYDEKEWKKDEHLLGPFPRSGVYDFVAFHVDNEGRYLPLDNSALNHVRIWAHWRGKGAKRSIEELMAQKLALWNKRFLERKEAAERVATEFGEQVVKCFEDTPNTAPAFGDQINGAFEKTGSGIYIPKN